jgi:hypothetical protein
VIGGRGADVLIGGPGQDTIYGDNDAGGCGPIICAIQEGSDTIRARDGERDTINCGVGFDSAEVDAVDVVEGCDQVEVAAGGTGTGAGGGGEQGGSALTLPTKPGLRMLAAGKLRIGVSCIAKCTAKVKLLAGKTLARKLKLGRSRVVATGSAKRGGAGKLSVRLVVPASLRARLRRLRSARLTLELVLVQNGHRKVTRKPLRLGR